MAVVAARETELLGRIHVCHETSYGIAERQHWDS